MDWMGSFFFRFVKKKARNSAKSDKEKNIKRKVSILNKSTGISCAKWITDFFVMPRHEASQRDFF